MLRSERRTWMTPSKAQFRLWRIRGVRRPGRCASGSVGTVMSREFALGAPSPFRARSRGGGGARARAARARPRPPPAGRGRRPPAGAAPRLPAPAGRQLARHAVWQGLAAVDREGEDIRRLVDPEVVALQLPHPLGAHEDDPEVAVVDPLAGPKAGGVPPDPPLHER